MAAAGPQRSQGSLSFRYTCEEPDSEVYAGGGNVDGRLGFYGYFVTSLIIILACSALSIGLWSEMACGAQCLKYVPQFRLYAGGTSMIGVVILLGLYLSDFFCPPHLPGQFLCLWSGDRCVGRGLLVIALGSFFAFSIIMGARIPTVPIMVSMFWSPACILLLRWLVKPESAVEPANVAAEGAEEKPDSFDELHRKMRELRRLTGGEVDQRNFYMAVGRAYALCGLVCSVVFAAWAFESTTDFEAEMDQKERELLYIRWGVPLGIAVANFMFGLLMWLRVILHKTYTGTDEVKARLIVEATSRKMSQDILRYRIHAAASTASRTSTSTDSGDDMEAKAEAYLAQQCASVQRLSNIIKLFNATTLVILAALLVSFQFASRESHLALFVHAFIGILALMFIVSTMISFSRLWWRLGTWLHDLPLWKSCIEATKMSWARALAAMLALPFIPVVLVLSSFNQFIRRRRGLSSGGPELLTARVRDTIADVRSWTWIPIVLWCYVWGVVLVLYKAMPILLNVFLAWMGVAMEGFNFILLMVVTFAAGFFLFMLPPVPGPPIYLFGGFVISDRCPWGFWWGALCCILLCFVLKLTACAVQQKIIGGLMSNSLWVRQTCGVHTPLMRAIERVLRRPGLSFGKVMILCGGPDWPTSVLAGILRISLFQCELGTTPIISSVVTLCLSGSFYLKGDEGEAWVRMGNLMFLLTGVLNMTFWAGLAWAIQDEYEKHQAEITRPREEFVELEWLDYRSAYISERCAVTWSEVPWIVRTLYAFGALMLGIVGYLFFGTQCFGKFELGDSLDEVSWFGPQGLIRPLGVYGLYVAAASFTFLIPYKVWRTNQSRLLVRKAAEEIAGEEKEWKEKRAREAREAAARLHASSAEELAAEEVKMLSRHLSQQSGTFLPSEDDDVDPPMVNMGSVQPPATGKGVRRDAGLSGGGTSPSGLSQESQVTLEV